jgi:hypothetical protein
MEDNVKRGGCFSMCTRRRFGPVFCRFVFATLFEICTTNEGVVNTPSRLPLRAFLTTF